VIDAAGGGATVPPCFAALCDVIQVPACGERREPSGDRTWMLNQAKAAREQEEEQICFGLAFALRPTNYIIYG
jgi:hypothetical protein